MNLDEPAPRPRDELTTSLDKVFDPFNRSDGPGLVIGVAFRGETLYRRACGLASVQHGVANLPATRMRIASVSKHITSFALLLLAEDGELDIDAPADRYIPGLPALHGMPTLRQFMNHTSGYRCTLDLGTLANGLAEQPARWQEKALLRQSGVHFAPNCGQMYNNGTYRALTLVVERVSGLSFAEFLKSRVFAPLGMTDTEHVTSDYAMVPGLASPHVPADGGGWRRPEVDSAFHGDGGLVSTVDDLLRWLAHMTGPKIVGNEATWRQMLGVIQLENGLRSPYSMGLLKTDYRGVPTLAHSGGLSGYSTYVMAVPSHGLHVALLSNGAPILTQDIVRRVVDLVLGDSALGVPQRMVDAAAFSHLIGVRYVGESGTLLSFGERDGSLGVALSNMARFAPIRDDGDLARVGFEDWTQGPYVWRKNDFFADSDGGAPATLPTTVSGYDEVFTRLPVHAPAAATVATSLVGRYRSEDLQADAAIAMRGDALVLTLRGDYSGARELELQPFSATSFGATELATPHERYAVRFDEPNISGRGFSVDTFRARQVRFERV